MIKARHGHTFRFITLYYENKDGLRIPLTATESLEQCGFPGGSRSEPQFVQLYYDFDVERNDCPILQCDHYFIDDRDRKGAITEIKVK